MQDCPRGDKLKATQYARQEEAFGKEERYDNLLQENKLFFALDIINEKLSLACDMSGEEQEAQGLRSLLAAPHHKTLTSQINS